MRSTASRSATRCRSRLRSRSRRRSPPSSSRRAARSGSARSGCGCSTRPGTLRVRSASSRSTRACCTAATLCSRAAGGGSICPADRRRRSSSRSLGWRSKRLDDRLRVARSAGGARADHGGLPGPWSGDHDRTRTAMARDGPQRAAASGLQGRGWRAWTPVSPTDQSAVNIFRYETPVLHRRKPSAS